MDHGAKYAALDVSDKTTHICVVDGEGAINIEAVREEDKYQGVCLSLLARLDKAMITVKVDIGFGDRVYPPPERRIFPSLLPDIPGANVLMYPPETVVAEKFEAMIRFGVLNSRAKDFHDIWVTTRTFSFQLPHLVEAVAGTLRRRETEFPVNMPVGLTDAFAKVAEERGLWTGFLRRNPPTLEPPPFLQLQAELRRFFAPIIIDLGLPEGARGTWDPDAIVWRDR